VDLYAWIPSAGYGLIIFRVHGGVNQQIQGNPVGLYTSEQYSELGYPEEQLGDRVGVGRAYDRNDTVVFAVTPKFIKERSAADYPGTIVILMGCYGLFSTDLPQAFIDRGASVVIGWKGLVGLEHTDKATLVLLEAIVLDKLKIQDSVERTLDRVGPDPESKSTLTYYPETKGDLVFSDLHPSGFFMVSSMAPISTRKEMVSELTSGRTC